MEKYVGANSLRKDTKFCSLQIACALASQFKYVLIIIEGAERGIRGTSQVTMIDIKGHCKRKLCGLFLMSSFRSETKVRYKQPSDYYLHRHRGT